MLQKKLCLCWQFPKEFRHFPFPSIWWNFPSLRTSDNVRGTLTISDSDNLFWANKYFMKMLHGNLSANARFFADDAQIQRPSKSKYLALWNKLLWVQYGWRKTNQESQMWEKGLPFSKRGIVVEIGISMHKLITLFLIKNLTIWVGKRLG